MPANKYIAKKPKPKNLRKKKITIQQTQKLLEERGYELGRGRFDLRTKQAYYMVTTPEGVSREYAAVDLIELLES